MDQAGRETRHGPYLHHTTSNLLPPSSVTGSDACMEGRVVEVLRCGQIARKQNTLNTRGPF